MPTLGLTPLRPPSVNASRVEALRGLWMDAGRETVETRKITVQRAFPNFHNFWSTTTGATLKATLAGTEADAMEELKARVRASLPADAQGQITYRARANAVKGSVPKSSLHGSPFSSSADS